MFNGQEDASVVIRDGVYSLQFSNNDKCIFALGIDQILVDARGRIWLPASSSLAVVEPSIFEKESILEGDFILYTEENSGYLTGHEIIVGPEGRFWSLDMSGNGLVWIDPNANELEKPITPWIAEMMTSSGFSLGMNIISSGLMLVLTFIIYFIVRKRDKPSRKLEI